MAISNFLLTLTNNQIKRISEGLVITFNENKKKVKNKALIKVLVLYHKISLKNVFNAFRYKIKSKISMKNNQPEANENNHINTNNTVNKEDKIINQKSDSSNKRNIKSNNIVNKKNTNNIDKEQNAVNIQKSVKSPKISNLQKSIKSPKVQSSDFISRLKEFDEKRKEKKIDQEKRIDLEYNSLCPFSPKINIISNNEYNSGNKELMSKSTNAFERLYRNKDYKAKKDKNLSSSERPLSKPTISLKTFEKMYNKHKEYQINKSILQKKIDNERGITYKPQSFTNNCGYEVKGNFEERNKKLIEDKQNFIFVYDYLRQKNYEENQFNYKSKEFNNQNYLSQYNDENKNSDNKQKSDIEYDDIPDED